MQFNRRECLQLLSAAPLLQVTASKKPDSSQADASEPKDWTCPMDPDVHSDKPGKCPRCGMQLLLHVPDRVEYPLRLTIEPRNLQPNQVVNLTLTVVDPNGSPVKHFETVHEKLMHLFVVGEDLTFFQHIHPVAQANGDFTISVRPPAGGMYRLLADYYPSGAVPQLALGTFFVAGTPPAKQLDMGRREQSSTNLTASFHAEPQPVLAGFEMRLVYDLRPSEGLELYLGVWGHMLAASEDLIDLIHIHPFLVTGSVIQFNAIFPRACKYKIWAQFQRLSQVNTFAFTVEAKNL
ncbi:MAG TPA: heavy metal-binding domain-containing protein [Bryobacteraceae bacterium]|jgi:hypothetical protein|nr:heavy metal-binding domain-containing protein [Bryobacteraceae bacterium]